jgi:hypothetical protein
MRVRGTGTHGLRSSPPTNTSFPGVNPSTSAARPRARAPVDTEFNTEERSHDVAKSGKAWSWLIGLGLRTTTRQRRSGFDLQRMIFAAEEDSRQTRETA